MKFGSAEALEYLAELDRRNEQMELLSAACKKKRGKLWQKERGLDDASPLDRKIIFKRKF